MSGETQAKFHYHRETAPEDRQHARLELESMQAAAPVAGEVRIMKMQIHTGKVVQETLHSARTLSVEDVQRVAFILQQVRPNPDYVRRTGGYKRVGKSTRYSAPVLFLSFNGEWRELNDCAITATGEEGKRWLLEKKLLEELRAIVERNAPKCPKK